MKICKMADKIKRQTGAGYVLRAGKCGTTFAEFCASDFDEYDKICKNALRIKGAEVEYHTYSRVVRLWTVEDWNTVRGYNAEVKSLVDGFWEALHNLGREAAGKYFNDHAADYARLGI